MALRILTKFKFINIIQHSRTLSSAITVRHNVIPLKSYEIKQLLDVQVSKSGFRFKYDHKKGNKAASDVDEDYDNASMQEFADDVDKKQITKIRVQSLRCDLLLKSALNLGRSKIEAAFYEGKIRLNGRKINKKSVHCDSGDVIEMIRSESTTNPDHLSVARIEVIDVKTDGEEFIFVTMKRFKNLTVNKDDMKI